MVQGGALPGAVNYVGVAWRGVLCWRMMASAQQRRQRLVNTAMQQAVLAALPHSAACCFDVPTSGCTGSSGGLCCGAQAQPSAAQAYVPCVCIVGGVCVLLTFFGVCALQHLTSVVCLIRLALSPIQAPVYLLVCLGYAAIRHQQ